MLLSPNYRIVLGEGSILLKKVYKLRHTRGSVTIENRVVMKIMPAA